MIDKSIRQHYQDGEKVGPFKRGMEMIMPKLKAQALPQEGKKLPNIIKAPLQRAALNKLGLGALNPVLGLLSLLGIDPMAWLGGKMTQGGALQAFQTGFGSPQEQKELRVLENRRAKMLQRKEEGRNYSEKNLDMVTRAVAQAKGLDINNPNEMRNIDKPITQIQIEKRVTEPQIIPEEPEIKSPFAKVIPKTPEIISPHLEGDRTIPTPTLTTDFAFEDAKRAAQEKAEQDKIAAAQVQQAAAIQAENDRQQRERDAAAAATARAARTQQAREESRGGVGRNGGNGGSTGTGAGGMGAPGGGGYGPWRAKGGRVDKALGGRIRDI